MKRYTRYSGESDEQLLLRMFYDKDVSGNSWNDIAEEMNRLTGNSFGESAYRKKVMAFSKMFESNKEKLVGPDAASEMDKKLRELERAKIQYRDWHNSWQKQNYTDARVEQKLDHMEDVLNGIARIEFPDTESAYVDSDNDLLCVLSDLHIGQTFNNSFGRYDTEIAKERLGEYLSQVLKIAERHNAQNLYVALCGDMISGNIHKSIQVTNRENVIDQIKIAAEYISSFIAQAAPSFKYVVVTGVDGNHSRIDRKDDAIHDERLDSLILWAVDILLSNMHNVSVLYPTIDNGISELEIRGQTYTIVHGDYDKMTDAGIGKLALMIGHFPANIVLGHNHYSETTERNGVQIIRGGSLPGAGDQNTVERRLCGKPSQMCCVCDENGIVCGYPVKLS